MAPGVVGTRRLLRATLRAAAVVAVGGAILAPLSSLVIWSFTEKWF